MRIERFNWEIGERLIQRLQHNLRRKALKMYVYPWTRANTNPVQIGIDLSFIEEITKSEHSIGFSVGLPTRDGEHKFIVFNGLMTEALQKEDKYAVTEVVATGKVFQSLHQVADEIEAIVKSYITGAILAGRK